MQTFLGLRRATHDVCVGDCGQSGRRPGNTFSLDAEMPFLLQKKVWNFNQTPNILVLP